MQVVLGPAMARGTRIATNMGAANPAGAAEILLEQASGWACRPSPAPMCLATTVAAESLSHAMPRPPADHQRASKD